MFDVNEISAKSKGGTELMREGLEARLPAQLHAPFQIICSRVRELNPNLKQIYWIHDLPQDPELQHLQSEQSRARFKHIVFCGNWQANQFRTLLGVPFAGSSVIETAIDPIDLDIARDKLATSSIITSNPQPQVRVKTPIRLIYTSTPQRGLEILVPVFKELAKHFPVHLDVYSSFKIYGWDGADAQYEHVYEEIRKHPNMTYHGNQSNEVVREALKKAHIHAYPSIWQECNSRSVIEAMSAGCICVHPNLAGLPDTSGGLNQMYNWDENVVVHANKFFQVLVSIIQQLQESPEAVYNYAAFVKSYADSRYNWGRIVTQWSDLLQGLSQDDRN